MAAVRHAVVLVWLCVFVTLPLVLTLELSLKNNQFASVCTQLQNSRDAENSVILVQSSYQNLFDPRLFSCSVTCNVTFKTNQAKVSWLKITFTTTGRLVFQGIKFGTRTDVTINGAAQLNMTQVQFVESPSGGLSVTGPSSVLLSRCVFANLRTVTPAPAVFSSCGSVTIADSSFTNNQGSAAHAVQSINSPLTVQRTSFVLNGALGSTVPLVFVSGGRLAMTAATATLNLGARIYLSGIQAPSFVSDSTFTLNANRQSKPMIEVDTCQGGADFTLSRSTISYNLGGGLSAANCSAQVVSSKLWAQEQFGLLCNAGGTINAQTSSIYRNGWTWILFQPIRYAEVACRTGCNGLSLYGAPNVCPNATSTVRGYPVYCSQGLNKCSQCQPGAGNCADCNGIPFGTATNETCQGLNQMQSGGAQVDFSGTSPSCTISAVSTDSAAPGDVVVSNASMKLQYEAISISYFNTTSQARVELFRVPINGSDFTRSRNTNTSTDAQYCLTYETVLDSGAGFMLEQCLFDGARQVAFGNRTIDVPQDYFKISLSLSNMVGFDNMTVDMPELEVGSRQVAVEMSLDMSEPGILRTASVTDNGGDDDNASFMEAHEFVGESFSMRMELPTFALFNTNDSALAFSYSFNSSAAAPPTANNTSNNTNTGETGKSKRLGLVLTFDGAFDSVYYDPQFGLLLGRDASGGESGSDGGDTSALITILVPVLVGVALLVVVVFGVGFLAWLLYRKHTLKSRPASINLDEPYEDDSNTL